jgi:hypothetical protein
MSNSENEIRVNVVVVSISSSTHITDVHAASILKISPDHSLKELHEQISRIAATGLNNNGEILHFNSTETVRQLVQRQQSTRIFVFRIESDDRMAHFDLFLAGMSSLYRREHLDGSLFIHLHRVSEKKITQVISIPLTTNASISSMEILQRVRHALKTVIRRTFDH